LPLSQNQSLKSDVHPFDSLLVERINQVNMELTMEFHPEMQRVMARAGAYAVHFKKPVSLDLLFLVMAKTKNTAMRDWLIFNSPIDMQDIDEAPEAPEGYITETMMPVKPDVLAALALAEFEAGRDQPIRPIHLFMGMLQIEEGPVARMFAERGVRWHSGIKDELLRVQKSKDAVDEIDAKNAGVTNEGIPRAEITGQKLLPKPPEKSMLKSRLNPKSIFLTPELSAVDLTLKAAQGKLKPVIGREKQIKRMISILRRTDKRNVCLTGEGGTGKSVTVEGLAQAIADGKVPDDMKDKIIVSLNMANMVAGTKWRGDFEERMKKVIEELIADPRIILFIDEIHMVMGAGSGRDSPMDASNILKPALASGDISVIGATTYSEYLKHIESDKALKRRFQELKLPEPTAEELRRFVVGRREGYEKHHRVQITNAAISAAIYLSIRYLKPLGYSVIDAALTMIDGAASTQRLKKDGGSPAAQVALAELNTLKFEILWQEREKDSDAKIAELKARVEELQATIDAEKANAAQATAVADKSAAAVDDVVIVDKNEIEQELTESTDIPVQQPEEILLNFATNVDGEVVGRQGATKAVSGLLKARDLFKEDQPLVSILILGPTGAGKTWWTQKVAQALGITLERLDMSEYQNASSIGKLTGGVPIYVGHDQEGTLTEPVRRRPYLVLLLDEIEKAHPDLYSLLLQVMDYGKLKDGHGRPIDYRNVLLVMTSNVGALAVSEKSMVFDSVVEEQSETESKQAAEDRVLKAARDRFSPEFLNRLDEILVFHPLTTADIVGITEKQVKPLISQLADAEGKGIILDIEQPVIDFLAKGGFSSELGARQLKRMVKKHLTVPLAERVFDKVFVKGDTITVYLDGTTVAFRKKN
jgi:ATP-dependent Clp protease ATP-binding subunit ClpC